MWFFAPAASLSYTTVLSGSVELPPLYAMIITPLFYAVNNVFAVVTQL